MWLIFIVPMMGKLDNPWVWTLSLLVCAVLCGCSCEEDAATLPDADLRDPVTGLTPAEAEEVLVVVGDRKITLGDYAATLLRMDRFERLRYQTEERQKELLDEMIEVELLAQEARRRGLDQDPEVQLHVAQALRDELLAQLERQLPPLESFSERDVRTYYDAHKQEFVEPRRHRVQVIAVRSQAQAQKILEEVRGGSGELWAENAKKHSVLKEPIGEHPEELSGDLGFVSAPGTERGQNQDVPKEVREAAFTLAEVGEVAERPIKSGELFYIVKLGGISPERHRSVSEADRTIRVELRRQKFLEAEKQLEKELRKKYEVVIDEKKIAAYQEATSQEEKSLDEAAVPQ